MRRSWISSNYFNIALLNLTLLIAGCSKTSDKGVKADEIKYGDLSGKMVFRRWAPSPNDRIVIVDFDKKSATSLSPKDDADLWDGSVSIAPGGKKIAYSADGEGYGGYQVCSMSVNGKDFVKLTSAGAYVRHFNYPTWNSNGTKIYYVEAGLIIPGPIYSTNPDGSDNNMVAEVATNSRVCVSRDETHILFSQSGGIYKFNLQNHEISQLAVVDDSSLPYCPVYSPDEQKIAYGIRHGRNDYAGEPYYYKIMLMNADGSNPEVIITIPESGHFEYSYITWSPDGTKLAFNGTINDPLEKEQIYLINLDGKGLTQITSGEYDYAGPYWVK